MVLKPPTFHGDEPEIEKEVPTEYELEAHVAEALATAGSLDASDVTVRCEGSTIILDGMVILHREVEEANAVAQSVPGVTDVINRITLRP